MCKKFFIILCAMFFVCCLSACADGSTENADIMPEDNMETHPEDIDGDGSVPPEPTGLTMEEADKYAEKEKNNIFILREGYFYPIDTVELKYRAWRSGAYEAIGMTYSSKENIPTVNLGDGDQLVTFKPESDYIFQQVEESRYCLPISINEYRHGLVFSGLGECLPCEYHHHTEEINGMGITCQDDLLSALPDNCFVWRYGGDIFGEDFLAADEPTTLTGGYYNGTQWCEYDIHLNAWLLYFPKELSIPVWKTKSGYFLLDTSALTAGEYVVNDGDNWSRKYVVEIL